MTQGFNLSPGEVDQAGSHIQNLGSRLDQHGTNVESTHQKIAASGRSDKSGVSKVFTKLATKSGSAFSSVFKQGSRWSNKAGTLLKTGSTRTKQTESDVKDSFNKIHQPTEPGNDRPKSTNPAGPSTNEHTEPSSSHGPTEISKLPDSSGHDPAGDTKPAPAPKSKVAPAPDRLSSWLNNKGDSAVEEIRRVPPAQKHFGDETHDQMYDIEQQSEDYVGQGSAARPTSGGRFQTAFTKNGDKHSAVVMETYIAGGENKPEYTSSDGFLHQWGAAHAGFDTQGGAKQKIQDHLGSDTNYADRLPNKLPDTIYHQNISGDGTKQQLGSILGDGETRHQLSGDELGQVLKTDNGKSVNNIVNTYNDVKGDTGGAPYSITGGEVGKDGQGNYHLKFDIGKK